MVKEDREHWKRLAAKARGALVMAILACTVVVSATGLIAARWLLRPAEEDERPAKRAALATSQTALFRDWPKPDVAVVLSGQQFGYLQPCGCSEPQKGGLARRFNLFQNLRQRGWDVVAGDLGDIAQPGGSSTPLEQALLKYKYSMLALKEIKYSGVAIGANEMRLHLLTTLAEFALNERSPRVLAANLKDKERS